jgi:hypothetical protein
VTELEINQKKQRLNCIRYFDAWGIYKEAILEANDRILQGIPSGPISPFPTTVIDGVTVYATSEKLRTSFDVKDLESVAKKEEFYESIIEEITSLYFSFDVVLPMISLIPFGNVNGRMRFATRSIKWKSDK